jgi:peptidoglycan/LPS O-acetylase OafA/YrhL
MSARPSRSSLENPLREPPAARHPRRPTAGRSTRTDAAAVAWVSLAVAAWFTFSPLWLGYAFTIPGVDAMLWTLGTGVLLGVLAAARLRAPLRAWRSAVAVAVVAPLVTLLPYLLGWDADGRQDVPWWNHVVVGGVLTVLALAGLAQVFGARQDRDGDGRG